ncbi:MAG: response regulator [Pseudomonadota bacterium]
MSKRVLIVEDEANIAESISFLLEREGYEVSLLSDGAAAFDAVHASRPDLVVLDVMLPNRSGFDVLNDIRASDTTARTPVMMLTAKGQSRDRDRANELGATAFVTKPFSNVEIVERVRELAEGKKDA